MNRIYPQEFPELGEYVVGVISDKDEMTTYCHLLDYDLDGLISYKDLTHKRIKNYKNVVSISKKEIVLQVVYVDPEQGHVDLSKKDIKQEDRELALHKYHDARTIHQFFKRWSDISGKNLVAEILWPLYAEYSNVLEALKDGELIDFACVDNPKFATELAKLVEIKPQTFEATFEACCTGPEGIDAIKEAVKKGLGHSTEEFPVKILYTGKPGANGSVYIATIVSKDPRAKEILDAVLNTIEETLGKYSSTFARR